jgi:hypothetical protein
MKNSQNIYPSQMEQILKDKGFVYSSENGFHLYSIPGVPFSFNTHIGLNQLEHPNDKYIFNRMVESALEYSNQYLKQLNNL